MAKSTYRSWILALVAGTATLLGAAACGGGGGSTTSSGQPSGSAGNGLAAYASCLRENGVPVPDDFGGGRASGGPRADRSGRPTAFPSGRPSAWPSGRPTAFPSGRPSAWPSGRPGGGFGNLRPSGVDDATWQKAQQACQGQLPTARPGADGAPGGRGGNAAYRNCLADHGVQLGSGMNTADPKVAAAMKTCAVLNNAASPGPTAS
ncbi:hypothetical protein [Plantactinospora sp. KBS50]|uniref:hypothetical protein n=1 Tax=Plantactinospora sp. KBS50 TaxID=2024580 RepID=UPI001E5F196E|nr:hypothetical protein [Plantactinospora sp. KBS50]